MKKLALLLLAVLALVSCDNTKREYTHVHIQMEGGVPIHCEVLDWDSASSRDKPTYAIKTQEYGWLVVSSNNFMLYNTNKCPICNR